MGSCFSCSLVTESDELLPTAKVVSINGNLRQYNVPVSVSQVLEAEAAASSSSSYSTTKLFLCNSDLLSYDDYIPALDSNAHLSANQLCFVLPKSKLQNKLTASDMAALAVKASLALQNYASKKAIRGKKKARISPVLLVNQSSSSQPKPNTKVFDKKPNKGDDQHHQTVSVCDQSQAQQQPANAKMGFSRSGSVRRLQKRTSRRAKLAVRSFRLRLTTIYEGTVL